MFSYVLPWQQVCWQDAVETALMRTQTQQTNAGAAGTETAAVDDNQTASSGEDVTLEFWTIDLKAAFGDFFNDMIAQYESENPGG